MINMRNVVFIVFVMGFSCQRNPSYFMTQGEIFKTSAHIKYEYVRALDKEIFARLDSFDLSLNPFHPQSVISQVNRNDAVEVDDWFIAVFNKAQEIAAQTQGAYDITCAPFINFWGFGYDHHLSDQQQILDSLRAFVGYEKVALSDRKIIKTDERLQLNASSLAKGYAVDVIAELLESYGITNYMVEIGGEVRTAGNNPAGKAWGIEILKPIDDSTGVVREQQTVIHLHRAAIATSGNYRNFYIKDGKKYAHTIHPKTGYPADSNMLSASVICSDCMTADAWATAFMVVGVEQAVCLAEKIPNMEYLFIYTDDDGQWQEARSANFGKTL